MRFKGVVSKKIQIYEKKLMISWVFVSIFWYIYVSRKDKMRRRALVL